MKKHNWNSVFEDCPKEFHNSVNSALDEISKMEEKKMKKTWSKKAIITLVAVAAIGVTAIGAGKAVSMSSYTSPFDKIEKTDDANEQLKDAGLDIKCIDEFTNDYKFDGAYISDIEYNDATGEKVGTTKGLMADYKKDGKFISLNADQKNNYADEVDNSVFEESYNDIDIYTYEWTNKFVPEDYELTEQDKIDEANGDIVFSYGSGEVQINQIKVVKWSNESTNVSIMDMDQLVSMDELVDMAKEVIDAQ